MKEGHRAADTPEQRYGESAPSGAITSYDLELAWRLAHLPATAHSYVEPYVIGARFAHEHRTFGPVWRPARLDTMQVHRSYLPIGRSTGAIGLSAETALVILRTVPSRFDIM